MSQVKYTRPVGSRCAISRVGATRCGLPCPERPSPGPVSLAVAAMRTISRRGMKYLAEAWVAVSRCTLPGSRDGSESVPRWPNPSSSALTLLAAGVKRTLAGNPFGPWTGSSAPRWRAVQSVLGARFRCSQLRGQVAVWRARARRTASSIMRCATSISLTWSCWLISRSRSCACWAVAPVRPRIRPTA